MFSAGGGYNVITCNLFTGYINFFWKDFVMKKLALASLVALTATSAFANGQGTVEIRGKVVDQTCQVETNHKNLVVILPTVGKGDLAAKGQTAGKKDFEIKINNCQTDDKGLTSVYAAFSPIAASHVDSANEGTLFNRAVKGVQDFGKADNVNVQLLDGQGNAINLTGITNNSGTPGTAPVGGTHPLAAQGNKFTYADLDAFVATGKKVDGGDLNTAPDAAILGKKVVGGETVYGDPQKAGSGTALNGQTEYTLSYSAQYYATGVATAGDVEAFVTYNISYK